MLDDPYITQMNIDRYTAMLKLHPADESRARIEQLLVEANCQLAEAIRPLARAVDRNQQDLAANQVLPSHFKKGIRSAAQQVVSQ